MKPITKSSEQLIDDLITKRTSGINEKLDEISSKLHSKVREEKVEDIINNMKNKIPEKILRKESSKPSSIVENVVEKPVEKIVEKVVEHNHDDIFCPTCSKGHVHKIDSSGLKMKCTDGKCGEEFVIVPKSADAQCTTCGLPIKIPDDVDLKNEKNKTSSKLSDCPFCGGTNAKIFDYSKLMKK